MNRHPIAMRQRYNATASAPVGTKARCPGCGTQFVKEKGRMFCATKTGTKCKDRYWNNVTPTKRNNTTRISPASARFMERQQEFRDRHPLNYVGDEDPGWDGHKGTF